MRAQQVNKLYNQLTPHEQAALAFEALMRKDENDFDLILASVDEKTYIAPHMEYQQRMQGLTNLSSAYGIAYWKTYCQLSAFVGIYSDDDSKDKTIQRFINKLFSMNAALERVCKKLKVDILAVKKFAECSDYEPDFNGEVDNQIVEYYTIFFSQISYFEIATET